MRTNILRTLKKVKRTGS